jgi:hypothetical protein
MSDAERNHSRRFSRLIGVSDGGDRHFPFPVRAVRHDNRHPANTQSSERSRQERSDMVEQRQEHVLIAGGSSGMGLSLARSLLADGAAVVIAGRSAGRLAQAPAQQLEACRRYNAAGEQQCRARVCEKVGRKEAACRPMPGAGAGPET